MLSSEANAAAVEKTVDDLFTILEIQGKTDYLGERVSQLEHSLQCAYLAAQAQADDETIVGSLLHDVGRFISQDERMRLMTGDDGKPLGALSHEVVGEIYLRQLGFSEKVCQLVGAHVMAKRYLTATDPSYYDALSSTSKGTLKYQVCLDLPLAFVKLIGPREVRLTQRR